MQICMFKLPHDVQIISVWLYVYGSSQILHRSTQIIHLWKIKDHCLVSFIKFYIKIKYFSNQKSQINMD